MEYALKGVPVTEYPAPEGVVNLGGEWYYNEYAKGAGVSTLGTQQVPQDQAAPFSGQPGAPVPAGGIQVLPPSDEKRRILDLFKN